VKFVVEQLATWIQPDQRQIADATWYDNSPITLKWVAPMQRRRMTHFSKMVLHSAHQVTQQHQHDNLAAVFSSRHGDLHKTANLLIDIVNKQELSPTGFGLSVHNAAAGLFSIINNNTSGMNAIAAGAESFICAVIEAYVRLCDSDEQMMLVVHADEVLPEVYSQFADEQQVTHAIAVLIRLAKADEPHFSLKKVLTPVAHNSDLPLSLQCAQALHNQDSCLLTHPTINSHWQLNYHD
jgi:hypothetical protein